MKFKYSGRNNSELVYFLQSSDECCENVWLIKIIHDQLMWKPYMLLLKHILLWFADTVLLQQVDFLETILEETSDDLQSDSDRSGTTYWVGSDSETESVIHIRARQRLAGKKPRDDCRI